MTAVFDMYQGMELDVDYLKKMSSDYEAAKKFAVKGNYRST